MMRFVNFPLFLFLLFLGGCSSEAEKNPEINWTKEDSTNMNEKLLEQEDFEIQLFLANRKNWKMEKTGTGLRYEIYKVGIGDRAEAGLLAQVKLHIEGLDGSEFHTTPDGEIESFVIDKSTIETGIQEAIKFMRIGDHARLIVPTHLAHGLVGDFDKIPPLTTLVVNVELVGLIAK
jgi:FKBP-type peptidyl-prolyl cis-trans isomerase